MNYTFGSARDGGLESDRDVKKKKLKRSLGILSKIRYYVDINILTGQYYALIYPFLTYAIIAWGNTYSTTLKPLYVLQKKALHLMTFSKFDEHSSPYSKP